MSRQEEVIDEKEYERLTRDLIENIKTESLLNRPGEILPFGLVYSLTGDVWICGEDQDGKLTSVVMDKNKKKEIVYVTLQQARECRKKMLNMGWTYLKEPKVQIKGSKKR